jgi:hypothetical protein
MALAHHSTHTYTHRLNKHRAETAAEEQAFLSEDRSEKGRSATFIQSLNKDLYSGEQSLEERLQKGRHTRQKGATELHGFL